MTESANSGDALQAHRFRRAQWRMLGAVMLCYLFFYTGRHNFGWAGEGCEKGSNPYFWDTEDTLNDHGGAVFHGFIGAAWNLRQVPGRPAHEARRAIHRLVGIAAHLARNAIEDALAVGGDETKIRTARLWLHWGHHVMENGRPILAIYLFKHAWAYAYAAG